MQIQLYPSCPPAGPPLYCQNRSRPAWSSSCPCWPRCPWQVYAFVPWLPGSSWRLVELFWTFSGWRYISITFLCFIFNPLFILLNFAYFYVPDKLKAKWKKKKFHSWQNYKRVWCLTLNIFHFIFLHWDVPQEEDGLSHGAALEVQEMSVFSKLGEVLTTDRSCICKLYALDGILILLQICICIFMIYDIMYL